MNPSLNAYLRNKGKNTRLKNSTMQNIILLEAMSAIFFKVLLFLIIIQVIKIKIGTCIMGYK